MVCQSQFTSLSHKKFIPLKRAAWHAKGAEEKKQLNVRGQHNWLRKSKEERIGFFLSPPIHKQWFTGILSQTRGAAGIYSKRNLSTLDIIPVEVQNKQQSLSWFTTSLILTYLFLQNLLTSYRTRKKVNCRPPGKSRSSLLQEELI